MGSGYIQLLAVGSEVNIFNYNPNITFFKIYYRRHTNFFISNMEINDNNVKSININNPSNTKITIDIPKNGDFLAKSYLNLTIDEHYFELFRFNEELCSTLDINLLNTYDNYYIKTNNYSIEDIKNISVAKINYLTNPNNISLTLLISNMFDKNIFLNILNEQKNISLQTDNNNIFYNIDFNTLFYSFNIIINDKNEIKNSTLFLYILDTIDYSKLNFIQIDFKFEKISIKISYYQKKYYKILMDLILSESYFDLIKEFKIDFNNIYLSIIFSIELYYLLIEIFYINSNIFELELIVNKLKSTKTVFTKKINDQLNNLILLKKSSTVINLSILNGGNISYLILYNMADTNFFGNLTNEYYNDLLLENSNFILNIFNLNDDSLALNLLIKIYISLICYDSKPSIQKFIENVNMEKNIILSKINNYYSSNIKLLNYKLIDYIMNPDVLIVNLKSFYLILYSKNIYENFETTKYTKPFTNNLISNYSSTINNFYFNENMTFRINNYLNDNVEDNFYIVTQYILYDSLKNRNLQQSFLTNQININYINNNNLFDLTNDNDISIILDNAIDFQNESVNNKNLSYIYNISENASLDYVIITNCINILITESFNLLNNIIQNYHIKLYEPNGKLSNLFINTKLSQIIFPISSNIYVFTGVQNVECDNKIINNDIYFNKEINDFLADLKLNISVLTSILINNLGINIDKKQVIINNLISDSEINNFIINYYKNSRNFMEQININYVNNYLNSIKNINYSAIYPFYDITTLDLNNIIMYQQFTYVDKNMFNNSFTNLKFDKINNCNASSFETNFKIELNYEKFIFTINSPLYRIYFYYTFLSKFTIDSNTNKIKIKNDINILRDLTLVYIISFFRIFDENILNINEINDIIEKFNLNSLNNSSYFIRMNFICYDIINIFDNDKFRNSIKYKNSKDYTFLYNNFYFSIKNVIDYKINDYNFINNIPNICNNFKYNYDDLIILSFLNVLNENKKYFINFDTVYDLTLNFFDKNNFDFNKILNDLNNYINSSLSDINSLILNNDEENNFYYSCYYTTFYIGSTFDNINENNVKTINSIMSITSIYNFENLFDYAYSFKEYLPKQNTNFLNFSNIIDSLEYFQSKLFNIFINKTYVDVNYFDEYINIITSYINTNNIYLLVYTISEFNFIKSITIINKYLKKFNNINNSNISLSNSSNTIKYNKFYFYKNNFIIILYYYLYFIYECISIDINEYNLYLKNLNIDFVRNINVNLIITFNDYILLKYTTNIYVDCIDNLINLYTNLENEISIDFSTYYIYTIKNELFKNNNIALSKYIITKNKYIFNNVLNDNQDIKLTKNKLFYSTIDNSYSFYSNEVFNDFASNKIEFINKNFIQLFINLIENLIYKTNGIIYTSINDKSIIVNNFSKNTLSIISNYLEYKNYYYDNCIFKLTNIYNSLLKSYQSNSSNENNYVKNIITYILYNLKNFYLLPNYNYFKTLYYLNNPNSIEIANIQSLDLTTFIKNIYKNAYILNRILQENESNFLLADLNNYINSIDIYTLFSRYVNGLISNSLIYEQFMNRIIYLLCTKYLLSNSNDNDEILKVIKNKTLYDIVKLYKKSNTSNNNENYDLKKKIYLNNTSIYSNQSVFQIYNFENMFNNVSYTQNFWTNQIISEIDYVLESNNSYYALFLKFEEYIKFHQLELYNFKLDDGVSILTYFKNKNNYDELLNYIFNLICLNEPYSPNLIFINIIDLLNTESNDISAKLNIQTDHLKKKIVIYLFFIWIILTFVPSLLINYFEINNDIVLEYNLGYKQIDINLNNVLEYKNNMEIINWIIYEIFNIDLNIGNKNLEILNYPDFISNNIEILNMTKQFKLICSPIFNFNILCNKYVDIYMNAIGNSMIKNDNLFIDYDNFKPTLTNLVSDINTIYNNDVNPNNTQRYNLTFNSLKLIDIKYDYNIYDLSNSFNNKIFVTSEYSKKTNLNYSKTPILNFNLLYNQFALLLNNYGINYSNLYEDFNEILNYLRKSANNINDLLELFKGVTTTFDISEELTSIENFNKFTYFTSKLYNIEKLNNIISTFDNIYLIAPNDYDILPIVVNYNNGYKNFYTKYYLYNYNYNNFKSNYVVIYKNLFDYYFEVTKNTQAIKNIKNYDMNLYIWLFLNLIDSYISKSYFNLTEQISINYIEIINEIIKIYFTYNYTYRINSGSLNIVNLSIQNRYSDFKFLNDYQLIKRYLIGYYYYQLFSADINLHDPSLFKEDVLEFLNYIDTKSNINFYYIRNFLNCVLKFDIIIRYIYYKLNTLYNINLNTNINTNRLTQITNTLINYITDLSNIYNFFNNELIINKRNIDVISFYETLFIQINNIIDKKTFFDKFVNSLNNLIYWINDNSYNVNVINTWIENFYNYYFEYYVFIDNEYYVKNFTIDIFQFYYLILNYINYVLSKNTNILNIVTNEFVKLYLIAFDNVILNNTNDIDQNIILNPEIVNNILLMDYGIETFTNNNINTINLFISKKDNNYYFKLSNCIQNIFDTILNINWGIINFNVIVNTPKKNLRSCITFYNLYYMYLKYLLNKDINQDNNFDFNYHSIILDELYILYYIMIYVNTIEYIDDLLYFELILQYLTHSHKYIQYGILIDTIDLNSNFAVYMDCLNSNIIPNNTISNYYKNVQNDSIYDCIKYNIFNFKNNRNNISNYIIEIYNNQIDNLNLLTENSLGINTFYNIIFNTFSNFTSIVEEYTNFNKDIYNKFNNTLYDNIKKKFYILINNFGGENNFDISVNNNSDPKLFSSDNYKEEKSQITIFSLLNNLITNDGIFNNSLVILFFYSCLITWSTLGINIQSDVPLLTNLFYSLANSINSKILSLIQNLNNSSNDIYADSYFNGLNILLFNNYNNFEFINAVKKYFKLLFVNNLTIASTADIDYLFGNEELLKPGDANLYMNLNLTRDNITLLRLNNNKIINYKYLLGLLYDFNESKLIYYIKSIDNNFSDFKIQENLINYIIGLNDGLINKYGIIQLIDRVELLFDDQIVSEYYNQNYEIFIDNFQNLNKQELLNKMLGINETYDYNKNNINIVNGLKPYIKFAYKYNYLIPVKFFFENYFNSIPLISCMNTSIKIIFYLKSLNIYKNSYKIDNLTPLNIKSKLNSDFILVERDERKKLCSNKIDNLIEKNNYYELTKNLNNIEFNDEKKIISIDFDFDFNGMIKEIIWKYKLTIDNYEINIIPSSRLNKSYFNQPQTQNITLENLYNADFDFIINTKIYIDGIRRDGINFLDSNVLPNYNKITTLLNPYRYNTKVLNNNKYNVYSFSLDPEEFQPSGAINMNNYKKFTIKIEIDKIKFIRYLNQLKTLFNIKNTNLKISLSTYEYNIIRYQSGLAGLLFIK